MKKIKIIKLAMTDVYQYQWTHEKPLVGCIGTLEPCGCDSEVCPCAKFTPEDLDMQKYILEEISNDPEFTYHGEPSIDIINVEHGLECEELSNANN